MIRPDDLQAIPLDAVRGAGAVHRMPRGASWTAELEAAYKAGHTLLEVDGVGEPIAAYRLRYLPRPAVLHEVSMVAASLPGATTTVLQEGEWSERLARAYENGNILVEVDRVTGTPSRAFQVSASIRKQARDHAIVRAARAARAGRGRR